MAESLIWINISQKNIDLFNNVGSVYNEITPDSLPFLTAWLAKFCWNKHAYNKPEIPTYRNNGKIIYTMVFW